MGSKARDISRACATWESLGLALLEDELVVEDVGVRVEAGRPCWCFLESLLEVDPKESDMPMKSIVAGAGRSVSLKGQPSLSSSSTGLSSSA